MISSYNYWYVLISALVAYASAYAALGMAKGVSVCPPHEAQLRIVGASILFGTGIWAMHFIAMMAFHLPIDIAFDFVLTIASGAFAVFGAGISFWMLRYRIYKAYSQWISGILMGCSVAVMHFMGMASMEMTPPIEYNASIVALSVLIAILSSVVVFMAIRNEVLKKETWIYILRPRYMMAAVLAIGVLGMHYTAMMAASFQPNALCGFGVGAFEQDWTILLVVIMATFSVFIGYYIIPSGLLSIKIINIEKSAPILILLVVTILVGALWKQGEDEEGAKHQQHIKQTEDNGLRLVRERMHDYVSILQSIAAFYKSSQKVEPEELDQYLVSLQPNAAFAAIRSVGEMQVSLGEGCSGKATLHPIWSVKTAPSYPERPAEALVSSKELMEKLRQSARMQPPFYVYLPKNKGAAADADYLVLWPLTPMAENPCQAPSRWVWLSMKVGDALSASEKDLAKTGLTGLAIVEQSTRERLFSTGPMDVTTASYRRVYPRDAADYMNLEVAFLADRFVHDRSEIWQRLALLISAVGGGILVVIIWLLGVSRREVMRETEIAQARLSENSVLTQQLEAQNAQLKEALRIKEDFLGTMSHELRTPLNSIIGFAQILATKIESLHLPEKKYIDRILSGGWMLLALINDILDLSKAGTGKLSLFQEPVQPYALMSKIEEAFEWQIQQQKIGSI